MRTDGILMRSRRMFGLAPALPARIARHHLRSVVGVGAVGAFDGLAEEVSATLPDGGPHRLHVVLKAYERDLRLRVVRHGDHDVAIHVPDGGGLMADARFQGHLDNVFRAVSGRSSLSMMVEWGDAPSVQGGLRVLASEGVPEDGMPAVAMACIGWSVDVPPPGAIASLVSRGAAGPVIPACAGAVAAYAVGITGDAAYRAMGREGARFSRERLPLLPMPDGPDNVLVVDLSTGVAATLSGDVSEPILAPGLRA